MLHYLGQILAEIAGPFRLFTSHIFLASLGTALGAVLTWWLLPRYWHLLPRDKGREFAIDAEDSIGKPMSAGIIFVPVKTSCGARFFQNFGTKTLKDGIESTISRVHNRCRLKKTDG